MKRWGLTLGSFICCGLVAVGMLLQLTVGPVRWDAMAWPANIIVLAVLLLGIIAGHVHRQCYDRYCGKFQTTVRATGFGGSLDISLN